MYVGKHEEASTIYKMNIETYPNRVLAYAFMGRVKYIAGEYKEAINYYKKALKLAPTSESLKSRIKLLEKFNN